MSVIHQTIETITPQRAETYLAHNVKNRNVRVRHVAQLAEDIKSGRWLFDGQPIRFDEMGNLLDGQHRLHAVVKAGLPIETVVIRGLAPESMLTIDTNKGRKPADAAKISGYKNTTALCATARLLLSIKAGSSTPVEAPIHEIMEFIEARPSLTDAVNGCHGLRHVVSSSAGPAWYYMAFRSDPVMAVAALDTLVTGVPKYHGDPIHAFRERMISLNAEERVHKNRQLKTIWTLTAAWNHYVKGKTLMKCPIRNEPEPMTGLDLSLL